MHVDALGTEVAASVFLVHYFRIRVTHWRVNTRKENQYHASMFDSLRISLSVSLRLLGLGAVCCCCCCCCGLCFCFFFGGGIF